MNESTVILLQGVGKSFGEARVLDGIDLDVAKGEFLGLVGPNGAGKSTLLRVLMGLHRRTRGRCEVFGLDPDADALAIRRRCSYLPGETSVYQEMTGAQFLAFAQSFHAKADKGREQRLAEIFSLPLGKRVRSYSAGMKQKLAILAALSVDVDLYLLDEPDRALDATMRMELRTVLQGMRELGKTILLSSHHLEELQALATRLVFLRGGTFVGEDEVFAARTALLRRMRIRLAPGVALPSGALLLEQQPDGALVLDCEGDPAAWIASVPRGALVSCELGAARLEDLYTRLFLEAPSNAAAEATR